MKNIIQRKSFLLVVFLTAILFFAGCEKKSSDYLINEPDFLPAEYITYSNPTHQISVNHNNEMIYDTSGLYGLYLLEFPESYTTGTNLLSAHIRLDTGLSTCEDFNSKESAVMSWRNSSSISPAGNLAELYKVEGHDFNRIKCFYQFEDGVVSESVSYVANINNKYHSLSLFFYSIDMPLCDPALCQKKFDATVFEKKFLQTLNSFKLLKTSENYD
jgi:hypothetical protein